MPPFPSAPSGGRYRGDPAAASINRIPNSIDTLSPEQPFVRAINKLPLRPASPSTPSKAIAARGDAPNSRDGVVPYWSSHLEGAQSELIVPSNHSAQQNPQGIAEVRRILNCPNECETNVQFFHPVGVQSGGSNS